MNWPGATNRGTALLKYLHQRDSPLLVRDDYVRWFVDETSAGEPPRTFDASAGATPAAPESPGSRGARGDRHNDDGDDDGDGGDNDGEGRMAFIAYWYSVLRERYFDDLIERAVVSGAEQLLLLGAGFDTRCLRLEALRRAAVRVVEVDLPGAVAEKVEILESHLGELPANLVPVGMDLAGGELGELFDRGLERELRTVCVWQGVSYYLNAEAVSRVLDFMANDLPAATVVGFDACAPRMLDEHAELAAIRYNVERLKAIGEPYRFGATIDAMRRRLTEKGFREVTILGQRELERHYLHRSLLPGEMWYVVSALT